MASIIDANGLTIAQTQDIIANFVLGYQTIYGSDINFDSNTQDGQTINIEAQSIEDVLEVLLNIYNAFDPQAAIGTQQDRLYYINGIIRKGATYSFQDIDVTVTQSVTLQGLDADADNPDGIGYTVADNFGNQWILLDTQTPSVADTYTYTFRAKNLGAITSLPNTITIPVTIILGVSAVNNPTGVTTVGLDGETDAAFRTRQAISFANRTTNSLDGLYSDLLNLTGVVDAAVYENDKNSEDDNGIPAHGSWTIVDGGADSDIANLIYIDRTAGTPMKGDTTYTITTIQGQSFVAQFDRPQSEALYIKFDIKPLQAGASFDESAIKNYIIANQAYKIGQEANTATLTYYAMLAINTVSGVGSGVPLNLLISINGTDWTDFLETSTLRKKWVIDADNIDITVLS